MAEILNGKLVRNETNENAMGGTEILATKLSEVIDEDLLKEFQIVSSRVRELHDDKIRIFWAHDLPGDPESEFLKDKNNHDKFHKFVFVSNWQMMGYINRYQIPWSKCIVIHNAIEPIPEHTKPDPKEQVNLIYFSTPHRGLQLLVPVFNELCKKHDNIHLDVYSSFELYGWGQRDEPFKELFNAMEKNPKITSHGSVSNDEIREALQKAHILAYPSIWQETSCLTLMESMSAGLTCVHSNLGALFETASNWTMMYQYNEDPNQHAQHFYHMLDIAINNVSNLTMNSITESSKTYADVFYSWTRQKEEWNALLGSMLHNIKDRSIPSEKFNYNT
jgi:glycosyltransferase involved in cell wall biosynthesis